MNVQRRSYYYRFVAALLLTLGCGRTRVISQQLSHLRDAEGWLQAGDTLRALHALDSAVLREPGNAHAWYLRGALYWSLVRPKRSTVFVRDARDIDALRAVDRSLRTAVSLAPDSALYALALGRYFLASTLITLRLQAPKQFMRALSAANRAGDTVLAADALDELGMVDWRRYEAVAYRRALVEVAGPQVEGLLSTDLAVRRFLDQHTRVLKPPLGRKFAESARLRFKQAVTANASNERARRHYYMVLAEGAQWPELLKSASERVRSVPTDTWSWLALGLALQRLQRSDSAVVALDKGLSQLAPVDRERVSSLFRLLNGADSAHVATLPADRREQLASLFWLTADPLFITGGHQYRAEFLARVVFAELRWSSDDFDLRGADTDRGNIHIRYGPAPIIASFPARMTEAMTCETSELYTQRTELPGLVCSDDRGMGDRTELWYYPSLPLHFVFRTPPTFGTATLDQQYFRRARDAQVVAPVSWLNLRITELRFDTLPVQVTRFRGPGDSTDAVVFAVIDPGWLRADSGDSITVNEGLVVTRIGGSRILVDTMSRTLGREPEENYPRAWRFRAGPGDYVYSVEAMSRSSRRAARSRAMLSLRPNIGFAMSDVLVASRIAPKAGHNAERWTDFEFDPNAGVIGDHQRIGLLWETYWLASRAGTSRYRVSIGFRRVEPTGLVSVAARVVEGLRGALGLSTEAHQASRLTYEREMNSRFVAVDYLMLEVGDLRSGEYSVVIEVTDLYTGHSLNAERRITVR